MAKNKKGRGFFSILTLCVLVGFALVFLFIPKEKVQAMKVEEGYAIADFMGQESALYILEKGNALFRRYFEESGIMFAVADALIFKWNKDSARPAIDDRGLSRKTWNGLNSFWAAVELACRRAFMTYLWFIYALPLTVPCLVDGLIQREIRKYQFSFASPMAHSSAVKGIQFLLGLFICLPFTPIVLNPLVFPVCMGLTGMLAWVYLANLSKRA